MRTAAIIGGGWAGFAAALTLARSGWSVVLHEAGREPGGRARGMELALPDGTGHRVDNGQHILIGAYTSSLELMRSVGVDPEQALLRKPLTLRYADGSGLGFPDWPAPLDALAGIACARGWSAGQRLALLTRAARWRFAGFECEESTTVAQLCNGLPQRLLDEFIDPLCISALNTPMQEASASVFLRVLRDALFSGRGGSHFLVPRSDLGTLFPIPAARWLAQHGQRVQLGSRVIEIIPQGEQWALATAAGHAPEQFDAVLLACPAPEAARLALSAAGHASLPAREGIAFERWAAKAQALEHRPIATVYAWARQGEHPARLALPWLALRNTQQAPAQFVFDHGQLGGPPGLMAFVISHSQADKTPLQAQVLAQAEQQLGLKLTALRSVIDKRATFACTPALSRPAPELGHGLWACGDYVQGPYPATIEGAVRSGIQTAQALCLPQ
ncbi:hydroxysqualene dehydroxylase HpnE [Comamonas composti]|uniref:hydroxysqualene dehydroxylase HpnE n=1 Tax=Comamonas composti TaxID=408558 RepID=UPI000429E4A4|nr:hydroxysqualene dehydroxylase HpnE [Comamonas composti]